MSWLQNAQFDNANLGFADLRWADLNGTHFGGAILADSDFSGATLPRSIFTDANMIGADFTGADLRHAEGFAPHETTILRNAILPDLSINGLVVGPNEVWGLRIPLAEEVSVEDAFSVAPSATLEFEVFQFDGLHVSKLLIEKSVIPQLAGTLRWKNWYESTLHGDATFSANLFDWNWAFAFSDFKVSFFGWLTC